MQNSSQQYPPQNPRSHTCMLDAALDYTRRGWRVFLLHNITPAGTCTCGHRDCRNRGKHPRLSGLHDATTEEKKIRQWWQQEPQANIGIATGHGLLVVHIDPQHGGSLQELIEFYALPPTATVRISNGGWHLYFTYNEALNLRCNSGKLGDGIDCQGEGGYVMAPPSDTAINHAVSAHSIYEMGKSPQPMLSNAALEGYYNEEYRNSKHIGGQSYSWLNNLEAEMLPAVLLPTLLNTRPLRTPPSWKKTTEGSTTVLQTASLQSADPPLSKSLLSIETMSASERDIALSGLVESLQELGTDDDLPRMTLNTFDLQQYQSQAQYRKVDRLPIIALPSQTSPNTTHIRFDALLASSPPGPAWTIRGLLPEGVTLLTGKSGVGKSGLALQIALALTNGTPLFGKFPSRQGEVLFLGLEDSTRHMYDRIHRLLQGLPAPHSCTWAGKWCDLRSGGLADLEEWLGSHPATRLIVIDTLARVHEPVNAPGRLHIDNLGSILPLKQLARQYHSSILLTHHLRQFQTVSEYRDAMRTATATDDSLDCCILLEKEYGQAQAELHVIGHNLEDQKIHLTTDELTSKLIISDNSEYKRII